MNFSIFFLADFFFFNCHLATAAAGSSRSRRSSQVYEGLALTWRHQTQNPQGFLYLFERVWEAYNAISQNIEVISIRKYSIKLVSDITMLSRPE